MRRMGEKPKWDNQPLKAPAMVYVSWVWNGHSLAGHTMKPYQVRELRLLWEFAGALIWKLVVNPLAAVRKSSHFDSLFNPPYEDDSCIQGLACIESTNHISTTALNMVFVHMVEVLLWKDGTYRRVQGIFVRLSCCCLMQHVCELTVSEHTVSAFWKRVSCYDRGLMLRGEQTNGRPDWNISCA